MTSAAMRLRMKHANCLFRTDLHKSAYFSDMDDEIRSPEEFCDTWWTWLPAFRVKVIYEHCERLMIVAFECTVLACCLRHRRAVPWNACLWSWNRSISVYGTALWEDVYRAPTLVSTSVECTCCVLIGWSLRRWRCVLFSSMLFNSSLPSSRTR